MNVIRPLTLIALLSLSSGPAAFAEQNQADVKQHILSQAQSVGADDYAFYADRAL